MKNLFTQRNLIIALVTILGFFGFLIALDYGLKAYNQWKGEQRVENLKTALEKMEEEDYKLALADTYGGKIPQETLQMYIDAVEKGDYELASKYLIESERKNEIEALSALEEKNNLKIYLSYIKKATPWRSSLKENNFIMEAKTNLGPSMFINFIKYPNGIWKISEI